MISSELFAMSQSAFFTTIEVATRLKVAPRTVGEWIRTGQLRAIKAGRDWRVSPHDLDVFLHANANRPPERALDRTDRPADPSAVVDLDSYRKPSTLAVSASQPRD
jgi:excisionase family DNA binding protein